MMLRGLRDDPVYLGMSEPERVSYEAAYRQTLAGKLDELAEAAKPLGAEARQMVDPLRGLAEWFRRYWW